MDRQLKTVDEITSCIKNARKSCQMTQEEAAYKLGYSERQYRRFETEGVYDILTINKIAKLFNIDIIDILFVWIRCFLFNRTHCGLKRLLIKIYNNYVN